MNWEQFRAILWLRWRLTRNQMARSGGLGAALAALAGAALTVFALMLACGATVGGFFMRSLPATTVMFIWDGVTCGMLFFSFVSIVAELQRSESIELTRLLHLPIALKQVFVFNYLISLVSFSTVIALAGMGGLSLGFVAGRGFRFILLGLLVPSFIFMLTAWIYCLRGWLLSLMVNPRRRRSVIMWLTVGLIVISQSPQLINLAVQKNSRRERNAKRVAAAALATNGLAQGETNVDSVSLTPTNMHAAQSDKLERTAALMTAYGISTNRSLAQSEKLDRTAAWVRKANQFVPVLWLANGAHALVEGRLFPAMWGAAGMFALGWLGLHRAYRSTLKFYRAEEKPKPVSAPPMAAVTPAKPARNWVELQLPWLPEETAALAMAQIRSLSRAPEVRIVLGMGLFFSIFLPFMILWRGGRGTNMPEAALPFAGLGIVLVVLFSLLQLLGNQFGSDRDGFRSLVLLPTARHRLLLGKNLALLPIVVMLAVVPLGVVVFWLKLSPAVALATVMQFATAALLCCLTGNLFSILAPFRLAAGSLKPTKQTWQLILVGMAMHLIVFPMLAAFTFLPPLAGLVLGNLGWLPGGLVQLVAALFLLVAFGALYWFTLPPLGRLLQRRETEILRAVTEVTE